MKIALGVAALALLAAMPAGAQTMGGGTISPPHFSQNLPWTPPATFQAVEVSGAESTYIPSTFVTFDSAVAVGRVQLKELGKTVAEAATDARAAARANTTKVRFAQDDRGRVVLSRN